MDRREKLKNSFWGGLRTLGDLMLLNWLWFFTALPVVTVGPASCAIYAVCLKLVRDENTAPIKDFFRAFRDNFKQGIVLGIMALLFVLVAAGDYLFALEQTGLFHRIYMALAILLGSLTLSFVCYVFPLQAMFENKLKAQIKNAFALCFAAPGKTIMMWLILIFPVAAALVLPKSIVVTLGPLYLMMGFSGPVYLNSRILRDVFDKVNGEPVVPISPGEEEI